MPDTLKSLKKENDELKNQVIGLKADLKNFQELIQKKLQDMPSKTAATSLPTNNEMVESLIEFLSEAYDDLRPFHAFADKEFKRINKRLDDLYSRSNEIGTAVDEMQKYSYQYNLKILGLPESSHGRETVDVSADLCTRLFKEMGVEVNTHDIDIAHRIPTRNASAGPKPIICKFTRKLVRNKVIAARKKATNIRAESIGLQPNSDAYPNRIMIVEHLTPKIQTLFSEAKRYQNQHNYKFCWVKNSVIFLRKTEDSNHIQIHCSQDLENLAD